jgi:glycosyltransferase involved in cell wall biosynthesis
VPKPKEFDVTVALDYYAPYVSGLTEAARMIAEGLAERGWKIAVACTQRDPSWPKYEQINGVHVYRAPVLGKVSRAVISPGMPLLANKLANRSKLLHLHLPLPEAALMVGDRPATKIASTYHIDAFLPDGPANRAAVRLTDLAARRALRRSDLIIVNSEDQARGSRLWPTIRQRALRPITSPCADRRGGSPTLRDGAGLHVGFMGRIIEDKGIKYLIRAFRKIADPKARLLIAGDYDNVAGGSNIAALRVEAGDDQRIRFLGLLRGQRIQDFYASIDVFALPSVSESFGIVQAEAMMTGVPSVTTDLAGGRYPVTATGFGKVVPVGNPDALRHAIVELGRLPESQRRIGQRKAMDMFGVESCVDAYEDAFGSLTGRTNARAGKRITIEEQACQLCGK